MPEFCGVVAMVEASVHLVQNDDIFNDLLFFLGMLIDECCEEGLLVLCSSSNKTVS